MMRIDKFLSETKVASRSDASKAARSGKISVNGIIIKDVSKHIDPENDEIIFDGQKVTYRKYIWIMMNKPSGILSASTDKKEKTVVNLLPPPLNTMGLFPCGRLDKDTVGLILLTNDGSLNHDLLTPKKHAEKLYEFILERPYNKSKHIEKGVMMDGKMTKPAVINMYDDIHGTIVLTEGKYHQIKRMFEIADSKVIFLKRLSFGGVNLDEKLGEGEWRYLSKEEEDTLRNAIK